MAVQPLAYGLRGRLSGVNTPLEYGTRGRVVFEVVVITRPVKGREPVAGRSASYSDDGLRKQNIRVAKYERDKLIAQMVREDEELVSIVVTLIRNEDI
jgi:hypothetical protein|tara:strand:- start:2029 stop:2322 length:294 start_codon:yes stop_codon:yes gene_type:complete